MCHSCYLLKHTWSMNNQWHSLLNDLSHILRSGHLDNICLSQHCLRRIPFSLVWIWCESEHPGFQHWKTVSDDTCSPQSFLLLSGCCTSAFPTSVKLYFADTSPNQGINVLGFAFMPWLFFPLWNFLWGATRATGRMWPSGMGAWEFSPSKIEIYDPVTWTFSFQVFLVSNWSAGNHIDVKCSRRSVYVISNDRILFSYIHLRFQLFCFCACLWIYSVGFFSPQRSTGS